MNVGIRQIKIIFRIAKDIKSMDTVESKRKHVIKFFSKKIKGKQPLTIKHGNSVELSNDK